MIPQSIEFTLEEPMDEIRGTHNFQPHRPNSQIRKVNKPKVPATLQGVLSRKKSERAMESKEEKDVGKSKLGHSFGSGLRSIVAYIKDAKTCQICEGQVKIPTDKRMRIYFSECPHKDSFCESCLDHYTIYKVRNFQEVLCPNEDCDVPLDTTSKFFKNLPADIQNKYKKIHQFYLTSKDPSLRLCPRQQCEGIIHKANDDLMVCNECKKQFCQNCLLAVHEGACDDEQVKFFEGNLHYRQCRRCKCIIEKDQGCNHMTCRCGHEFCYVCGADWAPIHYNDHNSNGVLGPQQDVNEAQRDDQALCSCRCLDESCGMICSEVIKAPLKLFLFVIFLMAMILLFIFRDMLLYILILSAVLILGLISYSIEVLCEQKGAMFVLAILFFVPVTMTAGVIKAFKQVATDSMGELWQSYSSTFRRGYRLICRI